MIHEFGIDFICSFFMLRSVSAPFSFPGLFSGSPALAFSLCAPCCCAAPAAVLLCCCCCSVSPSSRNPKSESSIRMRRHVTRDTLLAPLHRCSYLQTAATRSDESPSAMNRGAQVFGSLLVFLAVLAALASFKFVRPPAQEVKIVWRRGKDLGIKDRTTGGMKIGLNRY